MKKIKITVKNRSYEKNIEITGMPNYGKKIFEIFFNSNKKKIEIIKKKFEITEKI